MDSIKNETLVERLTKEEIEKLKKVREKMIKEQQIIKK
jgi:hypothetical protein